MAFVTGSMVETVSQGSRFRPSTLEFHATSHYLSWHAQVVTIIVPWEYRVKMSRYRATNVPLQWLCCSLAEWVCAWGSGWLVQVLVNVGSRLYAVH